MPMTFQCDYCQATIDTDSDAAMIVHVHRKVEADEWADTWYSESARTIHRYCSQAHLAAHMQRETLPPPELDEDDSDTTVAEMIGCAVMVLAALALMAGAAYGLLELVSAVL